MPKGTVQAAARPPRQQLLTTCQSKRKRDSKQQKPRKEEQAGRKHAPDRQQSTLWWQRNRRSNAESGVTVSDSASADAQQKQHTQMGGPAPDPPQFTAIDGAQDTPDGPQQQADKTAHAPGLLLAGFSNRAQGAPHQQQQQQQQQDHVDDQQQLQEAVHQLAPDAHAEPPMQGGISQHRQVQDHEEHPLSTLPVQPSTTSKLPGTPESQQQGQGDGQQQLGDGYGSPHMRKQQPASKPSKSERSHKRDPATQRLGALRTELKPPDLESCIQQLCHLAELPSTSNAAKQTSFHKLLTSIHSSLDSLQQEVQEAQEQPEPSGLHKEVPKKQPEKQPDKLQPEQLQRLAAALAQLRSQGMPASSGSGGKPGLPERLQKLACKRIRSFTAFAACAMHQALGSLMGSPGQAFQGQFIKHAQQALYPKASSLTEHEQVCTELQGDDTRQLCMSTQEQYCGCRVGETGLQNAAQCDTKCCTSQAQGPQPSAAARHVCMPSLGMTK